MAASGDDWRLRGQETYLAGRTLRWRRWWPYREGWDHDHCEFCWTEFSDHDTHPDLEILREGFVTEEDYYWVCAGCFGDFRDRFAWRVTDGMAD